MTEYEVLRAEYERRAKIAELKAEANRRRIVAHLQTVYPDDWEGRWRSVERTVLKNEFIPEKYRNGLTLRQAELLAYDGRECLYGGSAGGGKSVGTLMAAAQYVHVPGYHALIVRKTYKQLAKAESILNVSKEWWFNKVKWNGDDYRWTFPSGATIEFGHLDGPNDHLNYQGSIFHFIGPDELTQFPDEQQYTFLLTRQRRAVGFDIPIRMRPTSNPGGPGHEWVKKRFIDPKTKPDGTHFIPARLEDNPNLDREDYLKSMDAVDPITRAQMLEGDWNAVKGGRFEKGWLRYYRRDEGGFLVLYDGANNVVERFQPHRQPRWQTCDPAASTSSAADHFVLSTWCLSPQANLVWLDCDRSKYEIQEQLSTCQRLYRRWSPQFLAVEEVLNQRALAQLLRRSADPPMVVRNVSPLGKDKLTRATPAIVLASTGRLYLPEDNRTFPLEEVVGELVRFTGEQGNPDDAADSLFYAVDQMKFLTSQSAGGTASIPAAVDTSQTGDGRFVTTFRGFGAKTQPGGPSFPGISKPKAWW
jgi:phage terminase large subunit-like protein